MQINEAFEVLFQESDEYERLKNRREVAIDVALKYFHDHPGVTEYVGPGARLVFTTSTSTRLDTARVKVELGARLPQFQKPCHSEGVKLVPLIEENQHSCDRGAAA